MKLTEAEVLKPPETAKTIALKVKQIGANPN